MNKTNEKGRNDKHSSMYLVSIICLAFVLATILSHFLVREQNNSNTFQVYKIVIEFI